MFLDTLWVANAIPRIYLPPVEAYRTTALTKIFPVFDNLEPEAEAITEAEFERLCAQGAGPDFHGDLSDLAERATESGQEYGETLLAIRQSVLNLLAAGLYHLFEQQQKGLFHQTVASRAGTDFSWKALDNSLAASGVDRGRLPGAASLEELRLAANAIKHGAKDAAGNAAGKLAAVRPDLFDFDPDGTREKGLAKQNRDATIQASHLLFRPAGRRRPLRHREGLRRLVRCRPAVLARTSGSASQFPPRRIRVALRRLKTLGEAATVFSEPLATPLCGVGHLDTAGTTGSKMRTLPHATCGQRPPASQFQRTLSLLQLVSERPRYHVEPTNHNIGYSSDTDLRSLYSRIFFIKSSCSTS